MIDIHSHFLPGIDDGAEDAVESVAMLRDSKSQGVSVCVATPHCVIHSAKDIDNFIQKRDESFNKIKDEINKEIYPDVLLGAEVYLDNDVARFEEINKVCIGQSNYVLVELSRGVISPNIAEWIYNLSSRGMKPILAHVERYPFEIIESYGVFELNIIFQVNADTLLSFNGRRQVKRLKKTVGNVIVGSDMHGIKERPCRMKSAYEKCLKTFKSITKNMFIDDLRML